MRTLPHWGHLLPLLGATLAHYFGLGWLKLARTQANRAECGLPMKPPLKRIDNRDYSPLPSDEGGAGDEWSEFPGSWCPIHECEYHGMGCPTCDDDEWGLDDRVCLGSDPGLGPDGEGTDGWYMDLLARMKMGQDPHNGWRD